MNLTMEGVFLLNPVVVSSSIFYLFRSFLPCFVSLTVLLQRTFSFGDFGMDSFLLFDFSFGNFVEGGSRNDASSLLNAMPSGDSKGMTPFLLATCFINHNFFNFLFVYCDSSMVSGVVVILG